MIGALTAIGLCVGIVDSLKFGKERRIKTEWKTAMTYAGVKNKSENEQTFEILKVIPRKYGYDCIVSLPYGKSYEDLEKLMPIIQTNMKCVGITMEWKQSSGCAYVRLIQKAWDENASFEPVQTKPYEVYIGSTEYYQDIVSDMRINPHVLVSGATGMGKSVLLFTMLLNIITSNKPNKVNIYLSQVSDKKDLRIFRNVEHVKYFADDFEKSAKMLTYIVNEMQKRNSLINKYDNVNNIGEYNARFKNKALPYIYIFLDEFAFYMIDDLDTAKDAGLKETCLACLGRLAKQARSAGIFLVTGLQRPDKENMPPIFKSLLCTRVAFRQNNTASSLVVIDSGDAVNLNPREAIVLFGDKRIKIKASYLDMNIIEKYCAMYRKQEEEEIDLSQFNYVSNNAKKAGEKALKELKANNKNNNNNDMNNNTENMNNNANNNAKGNKGRF